MDGHRGIEASTGRVVNEYYPAVLDDWGNIDLRYPGMNHRVDFGYDAAGRPNLLQWADFVSSTWQAPRTMLTVSSFNAAGQPKLLNYVGLAEDRGYNSLLQLTSIKTTVASNPADVKMHMQYEFSATANAGRIDKAKDLVNGEEVTYQYDSLNRLISAATAGTGAGDWGQGYTYDGFGNMSAQTIIKGSAPQYTRTINSAKNQIANWQYDGAGNVVNDGTRTYTYDAENRLLTATGASGQYAYDIANQRIFDGTRYTFYTPEGLAIFRFELHLHNQPNGQWVLRPMNGEALLYFGGKLIGTANAPTVTSQTVAFSAIVTDRLGSVRVRGAQSFRFYPYGQELPSATVNGREKFGTYFRDTGTGLDYANQRYHAPGFGRFMTVDGSGKNEDLADPSSWNQYAYVHGDPVNANDPTGEFSWSWLRRIVRAVIPFGELCRDSKIWWGV
jgi:RHS repeat-associated protein